MALISGKFSLVKNENLISYLIAFGLPEDKVKVVDSLKPTLEVTIDGNKIHLKSDSDVETINSTLIINEEVDEPMPYGVVLKSTAKVDGNTLTVESKSPKGFIGIRTYEFSDKELVIHLTGKNPKAEAKRFYKRM